jgi:hypothetical protein
MTEEVRWTPAGKAALAQFEPTLRKTPEKELRAAVAKAAKHMKPQWKRGAKHADDEGKAAIKTAESTIAKGKLPKASVDDAARVLSLIGASESDYVYPLGELLIRAHGVAFGVAVAARMWSLRSESKNPDWPKSEKRAAIYVTAIDDDDDHVHDASCSYSKNRFADYLHRRYREATATERKEMTKAVTALWDEAAPHARPVLAYITRDPKRAKQSAEQLIHAGLSPWPFWAWDHLPSVIDDPELLEKMQPGGATLEYIANIGMGIWQAYADAVAGRGDSYSRAETIREFSNFYGPKTALAIAEYQDNKECAPAVKDYFTLYPELLDKIIDEPELKYHREDLEKLRAQITAGKPAPARPRSSRTSSP